MIVPARRPGTADIKVRPYSANHCVAGILRPYNGHAARTAGRIRITMKDDPTIAAVREARHKISESVGHDPRRLVEHYRQLQERHRDRLVSRETGSAKRPEDHAA